MEDPDECCCCQELNRVFDKLEEHASENNIEPPTCILNHPGFEGICLDPWSLEQSYRYYKKDDYIEPDSSQPE